MIKPSEKGEVSCAQTFKGSFVISNISTGGSVNSIFGWIAFNVFILAMLLVDLFVFHRESHEIKVKEALKLSAFWIALALLFNAGIYFFIGSDAALKFLAGYVIEKSLSVDNLFVFLLIFSYFKIPHRYQHNILFWGIFGALVFRAVFIICGIALIHRFEWVIYVLGSFLVITGLKLFFEKEKEIDPSKNTVLKVFRKLFPVSESHEGGRFWVKQGKKWVMTPLFLVLVVVETTDIVFAVDSIPAILAVTTDPFIVYSSNAFAILGLRALYFALAGMMSMFRYLHFGLGLILVFVGCKMLISHFYKIPIWLSLGIILGILMISIIISITHKEEQHSKK